MRRLTVCCLSALLLVFAASAAASQPTGCGGVSFDLGFPQEEFRDNVDNTGYGGGFFAMLWIPDTPLAIGVSGDIMEYGSEEREAPWSTTIPDIFVDVSTTNNLAAGHIFLRLQPASGFFRPYVEGLIGFHYLWTRTSVKDQGEGEEIASTKHLSDFAFSYGIGAGMMFRVWSPSVKSDLDEDVEGLMDTDKSPSGLESIGFFTDVRYLRGGEADYLKEGSIEIEGGRVQYDVRHSRTDIVIVRIGISATFL